jgi:transposase
MYFAERVIKGRRFRYVGETEWDAKKQRPRARQILLGPVEAPTMVDLSRTETVGRRRIGDAGALVWVAEQLDVVRLIDSFCPASGDGPSVGEMAVAVALQRVCEPGAKRDLAKFLDETLPRSSCVPAKRFTGQQFYRAAQWATTDALEKAQVAIARAVVTKFSIAADVLAFDTTNFDTFISSTTKSELAQRGHAKSKRADLRVVGLAVLASETGHVPLLHRAYPGNGSDQAVLADCLQALGELHDALGEGDGRGRKAQRTVVRDGGSWSEQLELNLDFEGYFTLLSLPTSHNAAKAALEFAAGRGRMKHLRGDLSDVRASRTRGEVGELDRTLVVVDSETLRAGQKRGIAKALKKARIELDKLARLASAAKIHAPDLDRRVRAALAREHLATFVDVKIESTGTTLSLTYRVNARKRADLEKNRLGRRVLCTDHHNWSTERIVRAFRGQWNVEELFRRSKKGGVSAWGPSHQWNDASLRLHTFSTVLGLTLASLARLALGADESMKGLLEELAGIEATMVRTSTGAKGRRPVTYIAPELTPLQRRAVGVFQLDRWLPALVSARRSRVKVPS